MSDVAWYVVATLLGGGLGAAHVVAAQMLRRANRDLHRILGEAAPR